MSQTEKVKIRGLARVSAGLFGVWGLVVVLKGAYDVFLGEPEANRYAPSAWAFVTQEQWLRYGGFELAYGLSCLGVCLFLVKFARFLPETITRARPE